MKPVSEVREETAEVLGGAVAEVARRAIRPELEPFTQSLSSLVETLEAHAEEFGDQVRAEKKALDAVNKQLREVTATSANQAAALAESPARLLEVSGRLESLTAELAATRAEQGTAIAALCSLRDEVVRWLDASDSQAETLVATLERTEAIERVLKGQAAAFSGVCAALVAQVEGQVAAVVEEVGAAERKIMAGVSAAREAGSIEAASNQASHQARHDAALAETRAILDALGRDLAVRMESGLLQAVGRVELIGRQYADDVAALRANSETSLAAVKTNIEGGLERLAARHDDHGRALSRAAEVARRAVRLAVVNIALVVVALGLAGVALWMAVG